MSNETTASQPKSIDSEEFRAHLHGLLMEASFNESDDEVLGPFIKFVNEYVEKSVAARGQKSTAIDCGAVVERAIHFINTGWHTKVPRKAMINDLRKLLESLRAPAAQACATIQFLHNVCADVLLALRNCDRQPLADMLEAALRDLPSSATIQAAPEVRLVVSTDVKGDAIIVEVNARQGDKMTPIYSRKHCLNGTVIGTAIAPASIFAATIQEPVMVAEPVGVARRVGVPDNMIQWAVHNVLDALEFGRDWNREAFDVLRTAFQRAAPMVSGPTGVSRRATDAEVAAWAGRHDITNRLGNQARDAFEDAKSLHMTYDATVKAVPSEALDRAAILEEAARCVEDFQAGNGTVSFNDIALSIRSLAAPLADKTGGGAA